MEKLVHVPFKFIQKIDSSRGANSSAGFAIALQNPCIKAAYRHAALTLDTLTPANTAPAPALPPEAFITRWRKSGGAERANYQLFISELCDLLGVARPEPATENDHHNAYTFDRVVTHTRPDGYATNNFIDCYKRGHFIMETKQGIEARATQSASAAAIPAPAAKLKSGHGQRGTARYDAAMRAAYNQAERYARALPTSEGWPPFIIVADIGHTIELYSEFSRSGKTYVQFPDAQTFRIQLADLARPEIRDRLRLVFTDPLQLDPSRHAAKVTRDVAHHLAQLSKSLEADGYEAERTASFLMRCIFTMFAEDVDLIPKDGFRDLLKEFTIHTPADRRLPASAFSGMVRDIWRAMDQGEFSVHLKQKLQRFNGGLFADTEVLPLSENQILLLHNAAACQWREVEPAIFGTLLERALNPKERHKLGAHYTPRAYVERLVLPTVIEPLRDDWQNVLTAAVLLDSQGKWKDAVQTCRDFLYQLTQTLVLDPACGTGNFLYVTLEHMKRLEGEVRDAMASFTGSHQAEIEASEFQVDPHQFLGIEINPRAAAIAELVLWIGYLQWQIRALGTTRLPEPVLKAYHNIDNRDAVLEYDRKEPLLDKDGSPVTRWDGETTKTHPVTGEQVPDDTARVTVYNYINPRPAEWPMVHFIVGNPPFLGPARMREALGDGYAEALRRVHPDVPESADFVMYWWNRAAHYLRTNRNEQRSAGVELVGKTNDDGSVTYDPSYLRRKHLIPGAALPQFLRFGFITTNSLRQTFNRRVLQHHMTAKENPVSLAFAIPDHPWVDSADGAAVRIAMTIAQPGQHPGILQTLESKGGILPPTESRVGFQPTTPTLKSSNNTPPTEVPSPGALASRRLFQTDTPTPEVNPSTQTSQQESHSQKATPLGARVPPPARVEDTPTINLKSQPGTIHPDLTIGAAIVEAEPLISNENLANRGVSLFGSGFIVTEQEARGLGFGTIPGVEQIVRHYRNGRDITQSSRDVLVIDLYGYSADQVADKFPAVYQWVYNRVKPERDNNARISRRENWWLFGETNPKLRDMISGLPRYIATVETSKHRFFIFLDSSILPDNKLVNIALSDAYHLGVLSSKTHVTWTLAAGSTLEDRPVYVKTTCFETFPFPTPTPEQAERIRDLAERLDAHRKRQQALHPKLTLTDCYNVLEKLRAGETLTAKDRTIHEQGLVTVLLQLHNDLDAAVAEAYGWPADLTDDEILTRLVDLNHQRAAEEARGIIRYLRPEYQNPAQRTGTASKQQKQATQSDLLPEEPEASKSKTGKAAGGKSAAKPKNKQDKQPWPKTLPEQAKAVQAALVDMEDATSEKVTERFKGAKLQQIQAIIETLAALGQN